MHWTIYTDIKLVPTGLVPGCIHTDKKVSCTTCSSILPRGNATVAQTIPMPAGMDAKVKKSLKERSKCSPK